MRDEAHESRAIDILSRHGGEDIHVHEVLASEQPADNPWSGVELDPFLPDARI